MQDCEHRIGMSELFWQLRGHHGVMSLVGRTDEEISQLINKVGSYQVRKYGIFEGDKFDQCYHYPVTGYGSFGVVDLALFILEKSSLVDERLDEYIKLMAMDNSDRSKVLIEMGRRFLTKHNCLIFITKLKSTKDWDSIKQSLLCESTRGYIVVVTRDQSLANRERVFYDPHAGIRSCLCGEFLVLGNHLLSNTITRR